MYSIHMRMPQKAGTCGGQRYANVHVGYRPAAAATIMDAIPRVGCQLGGYYNTRSRHAGLTCL